ncbi:MAG: S9 family peptidase [Deltaproteobacteria bacterium]|nr:S9 family peptidase [Deltaproteobacteria bacterium]
MITKFLFQFKSYVLFTVVSIGLISCGPPAIPQVNNAGDDKTAGKNTGDNKQTNPVNYIQLNTRREATADTLHGVTVKDPYRWLEDLKNPETRHWMDEQNNFAKKYLSRLPEIKKIEARLNKLLYIDFTSAPVKRGNRFFFHKQHAMKDKVVYYWQEGETGTPKVLLDPNTMSEDGSLSIKGIFVSHDGKLAAYKLSRNNADSAVIRIRNVEKGTDLEGEEIPGCKYAYPSWDPHGKGFYYIRLPTDKKINPSELPGHAAGYYHRIGKPWAKDKLVLQKTGDPKRFVGVEISRDGKYLISYVQFGWTNVDVFFRSPYGGRWKPLAVNTNYMYDVTYWKGKFYIRTNNGAPKYQLLVTTPHRTARKYWKKLIPEDPHSVLQGFSIAGNRILLDWLRQASSRLEITDLNGGNRTQIKLPGIGTVHGINGDPKLEKAYFTYSSFSSPKKAFEIDTKTAATKEYSSAKIPFDPSPYTTEQVKYKSKDGTDISMFIIHKKGLKKDGSNPFILYGYGGFNVSLTPIFSSSRIVWLENGGSIAIPNLRGGGEYGEKWHKAGMLTNKQNVFDDFIAAAEYLIREKYTSPKKLAIRGGSNGGLLVGAAMTQRPSLFKAVSCHVPLLDMVRYTLFGSGKTWISEYGDPQNPEHFAALYNYSPYHKIRHGIKYPALLMSSADSDDRVDPMHARKFTAAIQWASVSKNPVILRINAKSGHGGGDKISKRIKNTAEEYAFLMLELGMTKKVSAALLKKFKVESE